MKKFLKSFCRIMLWIVAIAALTLSLFLMTNYSRGEARISENKASILEIKEKIVKLEEKITELEEKNKILEEQTKKIDHGLENHIHTQFVLEPYYRGKGNEVQFKNDTVIVDELTDRYSIG